LELGLGFSTRFSHTNLAWFCYIHGKFKPFWIFELNVYNLYKFAFSNHYKKSQPCRGPLRNQPQDSRGANTEKNYYLKKN